MTGFALRRLTAVLLLLVAAAGCHKPPVQGPPPVLLFTARDTDDELALFQLAIDGTVSSVALAGNGQVEAAVVSPGGRSLAMVVRDGRRTLLRSGDQEVVLDDREATRRLRAVSDDGTRLVTETTSGGLAVLTLRANQLVVQPIDFKPLGTLMYGVALSPAGDRLAFSTMDTPCATPIEKMATCPVRLWIVDVGDQLGRAYQPIHGAGVSYDPSFVGGDQVMYMTNAGDSSDACRAHVNACRYEIRKLQLDHEGAEPELLANDAVLGRRAADGSLFYRRLAASTTRPDFRDWTREALVFDEPGGKPRVLHQDIGWREHQVSTDGQHVAVQPNQPFDGVLLLDRQGRTVASFGAWELKTIGWLPHSLPRGTRRPQQPERVRQLERALAEAKAAGGGEVRLLLDERGAADADALHGAPARLADAPAALAFWDQHPDALIVADRSSFCALRRAAPEVGVASTYAVGAGREPLVIAMRHEGAVDLTGTPIASFDFAPSGHIELLVATVPARLRAGDHVHMTLYWRVVEPPPPGWKVFVHVDGASIRVPGDHDAAVCGTAGWRAGDTFADTFGIDASGDVPPGVYTAYVGWYRGDQRAGVAGVPEGRVAVGRIDFRP